MQNANVIALRHEYQALTLVVQGLLDILFSHDSCNPLTIARMADEAKSAARRIASALERTVFSEGPSEAAPICGLRLVLAILMLMLGLMLGFEKVKNKGSISATLSSCCRNIDTICSGIAYYALPHIVV